MSTGEASQYEPNLVRNPTSVLPPDTPEEGYHLSEDLADVEGMDPPTPS